MSRIYKTSVKWSLCFSPKPSHIYDPMALMKTFLYFYLAKINQFIQSNKHMDARTNCSVVMDNDTIIHLGPTSLYDMKLKWFLCFILKAEGLFSSNSLSETHKNKHLIKTLTDRKHRLLYPALKHK